MSKDILYWPPGGRPIGIGVDRVGGTDFIQTPGWPDGPRPTWEERSG